MKNAATISMLVLLAGLALPAAAQDRSDQVLWARDIGSETITLDGNLDEAVWDQAESIHLMWGERAGLPGSGWRFHNSSSLPPVVADPIDPLDATIKVLRKGNILYLAYDVKDKSVGGYKGLWNLDGLITAIVNKAKYDTLSAKQTENMFPGAGTSEFIYSWWHESDTTAAGLPTPGAMPRFHNGDGLGTANNVVSVERTPEQEAVWNAAIVVDGTANDDTHGDDVGYTVEMMYDVSWLGYDGDQAGGDGVPLSLTIYDTDWEWPIDQNQLSTTKVWWQSEWGNNLNDGYGLIMMSPDVTLATTELPAVAPDFTIANGELFDDPVVDGSLDDDTWVRVDPAVHIQYQGLDLMNPGLADSYMFHFRPNINGNTATVVDPSLASVKFFYKGTKLYIGANIVDQAISGAAGEGGDGMRFTINHADSLTGNNTQFHRQFIVTVDSSGAATLSGDIDSTWADDPSKFMVATALLGTSTPADPTDVDEGYEIEMMVDVVDVLGYPDDGSLGFVYVGANLFDTDNFEDPLNDYSTRTWWLRERADGPGSVGYMDPSVIIGTGIAGETPDVANSLVLLGNYPNPFSRSTTLRYSLPTAGNVSVEVFDLLGRQVARVVPGMQSAGENNVNFELRSGLASGLYSYRIRVSDQFSDDVRSTAVGQMMVVR